MPEPKPGPLDAHRSNLEARANASADLAKAVTVFKRVVEETRPVLLTDLELAKVLASELKTLADAIHKEPAGQSNPFMGGALSAVADAMRHVSIDTEVPSAFERIRDFFWLRDNQPATVSEIIEASKASVATVRQLIYNRRRDQFAKIVRPGHPPRYRLTREVFAGIDNAPESDGETLESPKTAPPP